MSWGNDKNTLICEECGHEAHPDEFVWVFDELPICKDGKACHHRQDITSGLKNETKEKPND